MPRPLLFLLLVAVAALPGCSRRDAGAADRQLAGRVMKGVIAYPGSQLLGVSTGQDAAAVQLLAPADQAKVAAWFRQALPLNKWELERDAKDQDGSVVIYARQGPRPLWVTLRPTVAGVGTTYSLIGAVVEGDSIR